MKILDLFESPPKNTFPTEFGLDDLKHNIKVARAWLKTKNKQPLESFDNGRYTLYEMPRSFILVDHQDPHEPKLVYAMQYKVAFHKFIGRQAAQQIAVWREATATVTQYISGRIFTDHLLANYQTAITDSMQTPDGKRFWDARIAEAINNGNYVYYVNLLPQREIIPITSISQFKQLTNDKQIWGDDQKHEARRIIITTKPI